MFPKPLPKNDTTTAARTRFAEALRRQNDLALDLNREAEYQQAVREVAAAEAALNAAKEGAIP